LVQFLAISDIFMWFRTPLESKNTFQPTTLTLPVETFTYYGCEHGKMYGYIQHNLEQLGLLS